jgi:hypothetical protein
VARSGHIRTRGLTRVSCTRTVHVLLPFRVQDPFSTRGCVFCASFYDYLGSARVGPEKNEHTEQPNIHSSALNTPPRRYHFTPSRHRVPHNTGSSASWSRLRASAIDPPVISVRLIRSAIAGTIGNDSASNIPATGKHLHTTRQKASRIVRSRRSAEAMLHCLLFGSAKFEKSVITIGSFRLIDSGLVVDGPIVSLMTVRPNRTYI